MIYYCINRIISFDQPPSTPFLKNTNRDHQKSLEINMKAIYRYRLIYHSYIEMYILYSLSHFNSTPVNLRRIISLAFNGSAIKYKKSSSMYLVIFHTFVQRFLNKLFTEWSQASCVEYLDLEPEVCIREQPYDNAFRDLALISDILLIYRLIVTVQPVIYLEVSASFKHFYTKTFS